MSVFITQSIIDTMHYRVGNITTLSAPFNNIKFTTNDNVLSANIGRMYTLVLDGSETIPTESDMNNLSAEIDDLNTWVASTLTDCIVSYLFVGNALEARIVAKYRVT